LSTIIEILTAYASILIHNSSIIIHKCTLKARAATQYNALRVFLCICTCLSNPCTCVYVKILYNGYINLFLKKFNKFLYLKLKVIVASFNKAILKIFHFYQYPFTIGPSGLSVAGVPVVKLLIKLLKLERNSTKE